MNQRSSSTSSSEAHAQPRRAGVIVAWVALWLVVADIAVGTLFAYPADPKAAEAGKLQLYFDYGRSMEGKLARITRADPAQTAPITLAGWYRPLKAVDHGTAAKSGTVTIYGMSHAVRLAEALERTSPKYEARSIGAPGATANWAYGAFRRDRERGKSKAVVLAIMSTTVPMITTMSPMTWNTSFAMPYTADRFYARGQGLAVVRPPFESFADYVRSVSDDTKWNAARKVFERHDAMYDPFLMKATPLDHSTIVRMIRRAYQQRQQRQASDAVLSPRGFDQASEQIVVANRIVSSFAADARREGIIPVIFVINNQGYSDQLYRALAGTLRREAIPFVSSHTIVSPADPRAYLPDSHFTDAIDDRLAIALAAVIEREEGRQGTAPRPQAAPGWR